MGGSGFGFLELLGLPPGSLRLSCFGYQGARVGIGTKQKLN